MTTFTIDTDDNITAFAHSHQAEAAASGQSFASQDALAALTASWPMESFASVWNSFAGVAGFGVDLKPVKKFENRDKAVARIWKALQRLNGDTPSEDATAKETANVAPKGAKGTPAKGKSSKGGKTTAPAKKAPKTPRARPPSLRGANPDRARAARRPKWSRCCNGRTALPCPRSWSRWAGRPTRSAGSWPER